MKKTASVLVAGATGQQGGAVARLLLSRGHRVSALTRRPESRSAQELKAAGASIAYGDFARPETLARALKGADALYAMGTPYESGVEAEVRDGANLVDAARVAGIAHVVYSSVASANRYTGIPHFDSKHQIEQRLEASGLRYTIVAPVYFRENLRSAWMLPQLKEGRYAMALPPDRTLQQVGLAEVAALAVRMLEHPERYHGRRIEIASDELTGEQASAILSRVLGQPVRYHEVTVEQVRKAGGEGVARMYEWFRRIGYQVDIEALRRDFPDLPWVTFEQWARGQNWNLLGPGGSAER